MNARNLFRLLEQSADSARRCFPNDADRRGKCFVMMLAGALKQTEEPLGQRLADLVADSHTQVTP